MQKHTSWLIPLFVFFLFLPFSAGLDITTSNYFYGEASSFWKSSWLDAIYSFGLLPAWLVIGGALLSFLVPRWQQYRRASVYLILTLAIGSGLITHLLLKDHWGRPRPKQVEYYGGQVPFRPWYQPDLSWKQSPHRSFSCGHCTLGFFFFTFYFLGKAYRKKWLKALGLVLAFTLGTALSFTRIAQGGHFLSDTLASLLIMWCTSYFLCRVLFYEGFDQKTS